MEELPETSSELYNPVRKIESNETRRYLQQAIGALEENYRLLITLRYQHELSYEEIASTLNLPLGTVKTGIFRAKQQLRNLLNRLEESWINT